MKIDIKGVIVPNDDKEIYDWFGYDAVCPKDVAEGLEKANGQAVDVYINSDGGDVFAGSEIYSALREYGNVNLHVVGRAISAASLVLCAGKSDITPSGVVMLHNVSMYGVSGDYHEMDKASEVLKKLNESIAIAYHEKTGKSRDELLEIMNRETWMHADDAVKAGIVDNITQGKQQFAAVYGSPLIPRSTIEKIRNTLKNPPDFQADFNMRKKAQQQINILKIGGVKE